MANINKNDKKINLIINKLSNVLEQLCANDSKINTNNVTILANNIKKEAINLFNLRSLPKISFNHYLNKSIGLLTKESSTVIYSLIILDRFISRGIILNKYNIYLCFFISFLISVKINEDKVYNDYVYAKLGGIDVKTLITLEKIYLDVIDYDIIVNEEDFKMYKSNF